MNEYPNDIMTALFDAVQECSIEERYFLEQKIGKLIEQNKYRLLKNADGDYTNMGMVLCAIRELLIFSMVK